MSRTPTPDDDGPVPGQQPRLARKPGYRNGIEVEGLCPLRWRLRKRVLRDQRAHRATVITSVRGEGLKPGKTFLGLEVTAMRDVLLFLVADRERNVVGMVTLRDLVIARITD